MTGDHGQDILLECRALTRAFRIGTASSARMLKAVDRVDLRVTRGRTLAIVGESGCGKTTLGRMLLGILEPTGGDILIGGQSLATIDRRALARRIQPVFQDPYSSLNPRKTVMQTIALPLEVHKIGGKDERWQLVHAMMDRVGLPSRLRYSYPSQLSGGQRQRVAIARALIASPEIVICDEPTSALDVSVQAQILNLLLDLRETLGLTLVLITHDLGVVRYVADEVAVMYAGQLVETGHAQPILASPRHPYTRALLSAVLTPDPHLGLPDLQLQGGFPNITDLPPGCHFHPRCSQAMQVCSEHDPAEITHGDRRVRCFLADTRQLASASTNG